MYPKTLQRITSNTWSKLKIKNCEITITCTSICNKLRPKISKQVPNGQDTAGPSDPIVASGWVQYSVCSQKRQKQRLNL